MEMRRGLVGFGIALVCCGAARAAADPALDKVLRQLDVASEKFRNTEADLKDDFFERVVRDTTTQYGSVYFERVGQGTEMGLLIQKPAVKIVHFAGGTGTIYDPASDKKFSTFNTGNDKAKSESFLTLGFGGSGKELEKAWEIKLLGTENISDGGAAVVTDKLELVAKDSSVRQMFAKVVIWVDPVRGISLKQESTTPEGDKRTVTYSHVRYNVPKVEVKRYAFPKK